MSFLNLRKTKKVAPELVKKLVPKDVAPKKLATPASKGGGAKGVHNPDVLRRPRITEKASASAERGVYVFNVKASANKHEIAEAVRALYHVTPRKVRVTAIPARRIFVKGREGFRSGGKKAYVYLKPGQKIELA